ncbi:HET-domain-containing protein [Hypoxylon sp. FL1150]|nr:HET-domain-containing protein [Hypoxylon sp. FL1150]
MRLINTSTLLFEEFIGRNIPEYAILSHTWDVDELSFKDMGDPEYIKKKKKGHLKIRWTCDIAWESQIAYAWIDTCCIDKSSSAELTEAINSMYRWYERARICYVYLSDLPPSAPLDAALKHCRWFTRGWTLQELVAPKSIHFFGQDWNYVGSKYDLTSQLEAITGIDRGILQHESSLRTVVVSKKMSWAAHRETTRIEDTAYCLLGIFNVNMPLLYGEEEKAFQRLQEEIIKSTNDPTIFAWTIPRTINSSQHPDDKVYSSILAGSPDAFSNIEHDSGPVYPPRELSVTNKRVKGQVSILIAQVRGNPKHRYILPLHNYNSSYQEVGVLLKKIDIDEFVREDPYTLVAYTKRAYATPQEIYILIDLPHVPNPFTEYEFIKRKKSSVLQTRLPPEMKIKYEDVEPKSQYDVEERLFISSRFPSLDTCMLSLGVDAGFGFKAECTFIAVRWPGVAIQYGLVHDELFRSELDDLRQKIGTRTYSDTRTMRYLELEGIRKSSSVAIGIPFGNASVLISVKPTWAVYDENVSIYPFWRMNFSFEVMAAEQVPQIPAGEWDTRDISELGIQPSDQQSR